MPPTRGTGFLEFLTVALKVTVCRQFNQTHFPQLLRVLQDPAPPLPAPKVPQPLLCRPSASSAGFSHALFAVIQPSSGALTPCDPAQALWFCFATTSCSHVKEPGNNLPSAGADTRVMLPGPTAAGSSPGRPGRAPGEPLAAAPQPPFHQEFHFPPSKGGVPPLPAGGSTHSLHRLGQSCARACLCGTNPALASLVNTNRVRCPSIPANCGGSCTSTDVLIIFMA